MDIGTIGSYYLNDPRLMDGAAAFTDPASRADIEKRFAGTLEKALAAERANSADMAAGEAAGDRAAETGNTEGAASRKPHIDKGDKLYEQCEALETFLVKTLLNSMRNTVQKTNLIDTGFAGQMYEDMLYDEYAKDFTKNAGFGLAELAYLELTGQRGKLISR